MASSIPQRHADRPRKSLEHIRGAMVRADLKKVDALEMRERIGDALALAIDDAHLSQKEAAALVNCDVAQMCRWIAGTETQPTHRLFAVEQLAEHFATRLAEMVGGVVTKRIEFGRRDRRTA